MATLGKTAGVAEAFVAGGEALAVTDALLKSQ